MIVYEPHSFKEKKIPFIFHFDILSFDIHKTDEIKDIEQLHYKQRCMQNWHENTEIIYVTEGEGVLYCNSERIAAGKGDILIINSFDLHYTETENTMKYYCLIPDRAYLQQNGLNTSVINFKRKINDLRATELFGKIVEEYTGERSFKEAGVKLAVTEFMLYIAREHRETGTEKRDSKALHYMRMAIGYINSHLSDRITADGVAKEIGLSKYHFLREFKKITNMTLVEFINGMRCEKARKLLKEDNLPISEISLACGFENGSYFNKIFRAETGLSMSEYRRECRKESE